MSINEKIFKAYDIRGIYPDQLNEEAAYAIGRAFARRVIGTGEKQTVVASDMRISGPALKQELIRGITDEGVDVVDVGLVPIDCSYASVGVFGYPASIMITASHNPKEYNGFKMVLKGMNWIRGDDLKHEVLNLPAELSSIKGKIEEIDIMPKYIKHVLSFADVKKIKPFKVVVDAGNGMSGKFMPMLEKHLPIEVIQLNFELDGNFPAHPSNPLMLESQVQISQAVKDNQADFGVIFDGDTDRLFFFNEKGEFVRADLSLLILAKEFLNREPGAAIVYNINCSKVVAEKIAEWGGKPIRSAVGYVNVTTAMKKNKAIMGGEQSAHYAFRDNANSDSGAIAFLIMLQLISQDGRKLSEIISEFQIYVKTDELNFKVKDNKAVLANIKEKYSDGKQDELDGLTVEYDNWWFNVRPSNTEPVLRATIEADTQDLLNEKQAELTNFIKGYALSDSSRLR